MNTNLAQKLINSTSGASSPIDQLLNDLFSLIPDDLADGSNTWNVLSWETRKGNSQNMSIHFENYSNEELMVAVQLYVLHLRFTNSITGKSAKTIANSILFLDTVLGKKSIQKINNGDFDVTERKLALKQSPGYAYRACGALEAFGSWLNSCLGMRLSYKKKIRNPNYHGRNASDELKATKLMPDEVISDLINARHQDGLLEKDAFGIAVAVLDVACGFRVGESATLPADWLVEANGAIGIRYFPEKSGVPAPKWVHPSMAAAVKESMNFLFDATKAAREVAFQSIGKATTDWARVFNNKTATEYFAKIFCHQWTANMQNQIFRNKGVWVEKYGTYIDLISLLEGCGGNAAELARKLSTSCTPLTRGTIAKLAQWQECYESGSLPNTSKGKNRSTWDTDSRIISVTRFAESIGMKMASRFTKKIGSIIEQAQVMQLRGEVFPGPPKNEKLEEEFSNPYRPVIIDKDGRAVLWPHEALLVITEGQFAVQNAKNEGKFRLYSAGMFSRWLCGESRSRGSKNHEDSCWSRLGIIDPKTGETASYTSHDFRHWLNTKVNEGGLSEDQIALMFGRRSRRQNATYDQRSQASKLEGLRTAIKNGEALGNITNNYHRLAEESREEAEKYLEASTLMANILPHGICSNNWASVPCPHQLSCLSCTDKNEENKGPCELLFVDPDDTESKREIERLESNAEAVLNFMPESSPQSEHYKRVQANCKQLLNEINTGVKCGRSKAPAAGKWEDS